MAVLEATLAVLANALAGSHMSPVTQLQPSACALEVTAVER